MQIQPSSQTQKLCPCWSFSLLDWYFVSVPTPSSTLCLLHHCPLQPITNSLSANYRPYTNSIALASLFSTVGIRILRSTDFAIICKHLRWNLYDQKAVISLSIEDLEGLNRKETKIGKEASTKAQACRCFQFSSRKISNRLSGNTGGSRKMGESRKQLG